MKTTIKNPIATLKMTDKQSINDGMMGQWQTLGPTGVCLSLNPWSSPHILYTHHMHREGKTRQLFMGCADADIQEHCLITTSPTD